MNDKEKSHWSYHLTALANERTFLAYMRTALTLFVAGVTFIKFFEIDLVVKTGGLFVFSGIGVFFVGLVRFLSMRKHIGDGQE